MVHIAAFKGVMFEASLLKDKGGLLVAPPYDVLNEKQQAESLNRHPNNILHIDYGPRQPGDENKYSWHGRSGQLLEKWLAEGILKRQDNPAVYHMDTEYPHPLDGRTITRHGFVCLMRLEDFSPSSHVRPHEKTFSSHKEERLNLMKNTNANTSQVFGFFPDEDLGAFNLMEAARASSAPEIDFKDADGLTHKIWISKNKKLNNSLIDCLAHRRVYIADGHHRYETALNYRNYISSIKTITDDSGVNFIMVYLCPMSDPGLLILPTHRLLNDSPLSDSEIINKMGDYFKIRAYDFSSECESQIKEKLLSKMKKGTNCFFMYLKEEKTFYFLKKTDLEDLSASDEPKELASLDVVALNDLIFKKVFGLTEDDLDSPSVISYISNVEDALGEVSDKKQKAAFILNSTKVEDILKVTEKGLVMPRKSTYFYPKVTTGLVMNLLDDDSGLNGR